MNLSEAKQILNKSGYLLKESETPKLSFKVISATVNVNEDDYEYGEGAHYTEYSLDIVDQEFDNLFDLLEKLNKDLYSIDKPIVFGGESKNGILDLQGALTVNENCVPADDVEIEQWKKGEKQLYSSLVVVKIRCCELTPIREDVIKHIVNNSNNSNTKYKIEFN